MAGQPREIVAELRRRADIVEIIQENVVLKRMGKEWRGLCPFHGEKTPSFYVNGDKGVFKCHGCDAGGDVIHFLMRYHNRSYGEVLQDLANRFNVILDNTWEDRAQTNERQLLRFIHKMAQEFYVWMLKHPQHGELARGYVKRRGLPAEVVERFGIGFSLDSWEALHRHLTTQGISQEQQIKAGLVSPRKEGSGAYDRFRGRLMIPIYDEWGEIVAFGGRAIKEGDEPKYLNSPETPLYTKGDHLFGLHLARKAIADKDEAILMEGYLDVIAAHQFGFANAVAALGTALTASQAKRLLRLTPSKRIVLAYDADKAGRLATDRGTATLEELAGGMGMSVRILRVTGGKDPDDLLRSAGPEAFAQALAEAVPLIHYRLDRIVEAHDAGSAEGKMQIVRDALALLRPLHNKVQRDEYVRYLAQKIAVEPAVIHAEMARGTRRAGAGSGRDPLLMDRQRKYRRNETLLLKMYLDYPPVRPLVDLMLQGISLSVPPCQTILDAARALLAAGGEVPWEALSQDLLDHDEQSVLADILTIEEERLNAENAEEYAVSCARLVRSGWHQQETQRLRGEIQAAERQGDLAAIGPLQDAFHNQLQIIDWLRSQTARDFIASLKEHLSSA